MDDKVNSMDITNWLKAFAILAVCVNHFINGYRPESLAGYANGFISFFFLLSGFGIFHSLSKISHLPDREILLFFVKKRLMRIYPLFWIWCMLHGFDNGLVGFFALDFVDPKSPWFVPAIMQCYILAPFLFLMVKRTSITIHFIVVSSLLIVANVFLVGYLDIEPVRAVGYRGIFLLHIFMFYLGYLLAVRQNDFIANKSLLLFSYALVCFFIQETTQQSFVLFPGKEYLFPVSMVFAVFFMSGLMLTSVKRLPFAKGMNFIGEHTYSIYLFNGLGNYFLYKIGIIHHDNTGLFGIIVWSVTLPISFLFYAALETFVNEVVIRRNSLKETVKTYYSKLPFRKIVVASAS